jgi:type I restriction enzyme M protein
MFVQHMLAVLNAGGKMATIMPHGVLFRGGEEREARRHFIERGWLEAIIGLPAGLFYGTGIPACVLVMNKKDAGDRKHVLFINADRDYREGKAQNFLRAEDISRIVHAYRTLTAGDRDELPGYARRVPVEEIEAEDFNCNIRRYVDNAPPPEPHDVRAHLYGGVPKSEIEALERFWANYPNLQARCFQPRPGTDHYFDFTPEAADRRALACLVNCDQSVAAAHRAFLETLEGWWEKHLAEMEALAPNDGKKGNVYALRRNLLASIEETFAGSTLLTGHQIRGAFARYVDELKADLKSIAASGWGPELIPDADILQSQFPDVLAEMDAKRTRLAELGALFAAADEEDYEDEDDVGVLPSEQVKALKAELKELSAAYKQHFKDLKTLVGDLFAELKAAQQIPNGARKSDFMVNGTQSAPDFASAQTILQLAGEIDFESDRIEMIRERMQNGREALERAQTRVARLERHKALEDEAKQLKADLRATEKKQDELVAAAREKIVQDEARKVIIDRLHHLLVQTYESYLRADQRACLSALENLHAKYATTATDIEQRRNAATDKLKGFLGVLGYA